MSIRRVDDSSRSLKGLSLVATGPAGTAHGPAVDLKPQAGAATGGYLVIDQPQANAIMGEMEREDAINPITQERPELRASIFRTVARTPKENGDPRYSYWDPAELWRWLQQPRHMGRMPDTNEPAWFEDWWALYYTYGAPAVPSWAYSLEKRNPDTQPSASVREAAPGAPPAQQRNAGRDRSVDRPTLNNDEAASLWERIHGGGGQGPQAAPGSNALAERRRQAQASLDAFAAAARETEAYHLAEALRYRNAPPGDSFGGSNEEMEAYHLHQAALAGAALAAASANVLPNPFGSM